MISLNPYDPRFKAFQSDINQVGIDLRRSVIKSDVGVYVADPAATFRAGMVLAVGSAQQMVVCDGTASAPANVPFGFAKWNKCTALIAAVVDEAVVLTGTTASNLQHANIFNVSGAAGVAVRSAVAQGGTTFTETTDYVVNYTNGTLTRNGGGAIPSGSTVYVSYRYTVAESDLDFQGRNFWNFLDEVTIANGRITVITDWNILFTTMYDSSRTYAQNDALQVDGGSKAGLLTNLTGGGRPVFGRVFQIPSADDPFLGIVSPGHS